MASELHHGDMRDVLKGFALIGRTFHACVTDPPYCLTSVTKRFGSARAAPARSDGPTGIYARASRGFMGKTWDSDISFRPETWRLVYDVLPPGGHLLAFGGPRTYHRLATAIEDAGFVLWDQVAWLYGDGMPLRNKQIPELPGYGTALKPALEPIAVAVKPRQGTIAENLAACGAGVLNIDGCRVGTRWPANVVHDGSDEVMAAFAAFGERPGQIARESSSSTRKDQNVYGAMRRGSGGREPRGDTGTAARFFYCAKASRADRESGCDALDERPLLWSAGTQNPGSFQSAGTRKKARNHHPTVKPTELMRWLVRLVSPPGATVLDPFAGSGSTGKACALEGVGFVGIEAEADYVEIARARIAHAEAAVR